MRIVWDDRKRQANLAKHGLDFADLDLEFFDTARIGPTRDGRFIAIGRLDRIVTVVFAVLGTEAVSVVSMRPASVKEKRTHGQAF